MDDELTSTTRRFELLQSVEVDFAGAPAAQDYLAHSRWSTDAAQAPKEPPEAQSAAVTDMSQAEATGEDNSANAAPDNTTN